MTSPESDLFSGRNNVNNPLFNRTDSLSSTALVDLGGIFDTDLDLDAMDDSATQPSVISTGLSIGRSGVSAGGKTFSNIGLAGSPDGNKGYMLAGSPDGNKGYMLAGSPDGNEGYMLARSPDGNKGYMLAGSPDGNKGYMLAGSPDGNEGYMLAGSPEPPGDGGYIDLNSDKAQDFGYIPADMLVGFPDKR